MNMGEFSIDRAYSTKEYFAILRESELKIEYVDGFLVNMSGGTVNHNRISRNLLTTITNELNQSASNCEAFGSDQKIAIPARNSYFFPDISAVCPPIETDQEDSDSILNPLLIIEVASKSTRLYDEGGKFNYYQTLSSLREFMLIEQNTVLITVYRRTPDQTWQIEQLSDLSDTLTINSLEIEMTLREVYRNVNLP